MVLICMYIYNKVVSIHLKGFIHDNNNALLMGRSCEPLCEDEPIRSTPSIDVGRRKELTNPSTDDEVGTENCLEDRNELAATPVGAADRVVGRFCRSGTDDATSSSTLGHASRVPRSDRRALKSSLDETIGNSSSGCGRQDRRLISSFVAHQIVPSVSESLPITNEAQPFRHRDDVEIVEEAMLSVKQTIPCANQAVPISNQVIPMPKQDIQRSNEAMPTLNKAVSYENSSLNIISRPKTLVEKRGNYVRHVNAGCAAAVNGYPCSTAAVSKLDKEAEEKLDSLCWRLQKNDCTKKHRDASTADDLLDRLSKTSKKRIDLPTPAVTENVVFANRTAYLVSNKMVKSVKELDRQISRLCTPPRNSGPDELVKEIARSMERGKTMARLSMQTHLAADLDGLAATDDGALANGYSCDLERELRDDCCLESQILDELSKSNDSSLKYSRHSTARSSPPSDSECTRYSTDFSLNDDRPEDGDAGGHYASLKRSTSASDRMYHSTGVGGFGASSSIVSTQDKPKRSDSYHGSLINATGNHLLSLPPQSAAGVKSPVDSLKTAFFNLTGRLIRRRTRSTDAATTHGVKSPQSATEPEALFAPKENKSERFVTRLARASYRRLNRRNRSSEAATAPESGSRDISSSSENILSPDDGSTERPPEPCTLPRHTNASRKQKELNTAVSSADNFRSQRKTSWKRLLLQRNNGAGNIDNDPSSNSDSDVLDATSRRRSKFHLDSVDNRILTIVDVRRKQVLLAAPEIISYPSSMTDNELTSMPVAKDANDPRYCPSTASRQFVPTKNSAPVAPTECKATFVPTRQRVPFVQTKRDVPTCVPKKQGVPACVPTKQGVPACVPTKEGISFAPREHNVPFIDDSDTEDG